MVLGTISLKTLVSGKKSYSTYHDFTHAYIVTTHKIQVNTNDANFIDSQIITISCISITCLNSTPQYKEMLPLLLLYFSQTQLFNMNILIGTIFGKVPCFITAET